MSVHQHSDAGKHSPNGGELIEGLEALAHAYGNRFLLEAAPDNALPEHGMTPSTRCG